MLYPNKDVWIIYKNDHLFVQAKVKTLTLNSEFLAFFEPFWNSCDSLHLWNWPGKLILGTSNSLKQLQIEMQIHVQQERLRFIIVLEKVIVQMII